MTSELTPFGGGQVSRPIRQANRAIMRQQAARQVRLSGADAETDIAIGKAEDLTMATGTAMQAVTRVARAQRELEQLAPEAAGRLAFLADHHMLGMSEVLADLRHALRRC